jgi:hypothetical protein
MDTQLQNLSITELKALGYDAIVTLEQSQNNLRLINQEIQKRYQQANATPNVNVINPTTTTVSKLETFKV